MSAEDVPGPLSPHLVLDEALARLEDVTGRPGALYLFDIDGSRAVRVRGGTDFPDVIEHGVGVGKDVPLECADVLEAILETLRPGLRVAVLAIEGRGIGLAVSDDSIAELRRAAAEIAPRIEFAGAFTDEILRVRMRRDITTAGRVQQTLLPPETASLAAGDVAGSVLPAYDVGGDWFDYASNPDGVWLGVGDAVGKGVVAASLATLAVGAFRASRANAEDVVGCARRMHEVLVEGSASTSYVTSLIARWDPAAGSLEWVRCGHPPALALAPDGSAVELDGPPDPPLGLFGDEERAFTLRTARLAPGSLLVMYSDGVVERRDDRGRAVGKDLLLRALGDVARASAPVAVASVQNSVLKASPHPIRDDSTVLVFRVATGA